MQAGRKITVNAVAQAALFTHLLGQARHKATATQHIVAHGQGKKVRVIAFIAGLPHADMGLRRFKRNGDFFGLREWLHFRHRRQCSTRGPGGQSCQQFGHPRLHLGLAERAHHADLGAARHDVTRMEGLHIGHRDGQQALRRGLLTIRMGTKHCGGPGTIGHGAGLGQRFAQTGTPALTFAGPYVCGEGGVCQVSGGQAHGRVQHLGSGQAAQGKAHAVAAG